MLKQSVAAQLCLTSYRKEEQYKQTLLGYNPDPHAKKDSILKDGRQILLSLYRPEDKEALVSMYASMSPEAVQWGLPPYDRARIEYWTSDLTNNITLLAQWTSELLDIYDCSPYPSPDAKASASFSSISIRTF